MDSRILKTINIAVVSDFACPWCFIGKRRLDKAIARRPDLDFVLDWQPFQLNPNMPHEGRNRRDYYRNKFGHEGAGNLRQALEIAGTEENIVFCNTPDAIAPNTLSAHVLMLWAARDERIDRNDLAEKLFHAHHVACENIGDHNVLVRIAVAAGMHRASVMSGLAAGDDQDPAREQIKHSVTRGVRSVPFFIVNEQYSISGAQSTETLASAFDRLAGKAGAT